MPRPAIVLLSGGLDSATCLAIAVSEGFAPIYTMAFDYGQRHRNELAAAEALSRRFNAIEHKVMHIDLRQFGGSALTSDIAVPKDQIGQEEETERRGDEETKQEAESSTSSLRLPVSPSLNQPIPITYVPARNTIFLSFALAWCEVIDCDDVFIGVNALDYSGYPDCRPEYIDAFQAMARLGTKRTSFNIHDPLVRLTKAQIIRRGVGLGVDYSMTHSCYDPTPAGLSCGHCDSCLLRRKGFTEAGVPDPTRYA